MKQIEINGLLWDTENLEIDGKKYFTWQEAMDAAKIVGKRLPTDEELGELIATGYKFDEEKKGIWFADGKLFLPACGYVNPSNGELKNTTSGYYWTSLPRNAANSWNISFYSFNTYVNISNVKYSFPVRCVQDIKPDNSTIKENNMEKSNSQWKDAFLTPPADMQIVFIKTKCKRLLAGLGVGYKLPGRMAFEVNGEIVSYDGNSVDYYDVFWTEVPN